MNSVWKEKGEWRIKERWKDKKRRIKKRRWKEGNLSFFALKCTEWMIGNGVERE